MPFLIFWSGAFAVLDDHFSVLDRCGPIQYVTELNIKYLLFLHYFNLDLKNLTQP